jgi:hypothetical protein
MQFQQEFNRKERKELKEKNLCVFWSTKLCHLPGQRMNNSAFSKHSACVISVIFAVISIAVSRFAFMFDSAPHPDPLPEGEGKAVACLWLAVG